MDYPIPKAAADAFGEYDWNNAGLVFDRFAPDMVVKKGDRTSRGSTPKKDGLGRVLNCQRDAQLRGAALARWQAMTNQMGAKSIELKTDWRFVTGVGRTTNYEVGFRFDRYGFATLPGSSVKGIARAFAWSEGRESTPEFVAIFGNATGDADGEERSTAGQAIFFDAMPIDDPVLELDIMNPHYPDYYGGDKPPTNWQSPVPVYFLTVKAGVRFGFAVAWRGRADPNLHQTALDWLQAGLKNLGAGAKTNAGYGYFIAASTGKDSLKAGANIPRSVERPSALQRSAGRLRRKGTDQVWIEDGNLRIDVRRDPLGSPFVNLPKDKAEVDYDFELVDGVRRVWSINRRPSLQGFLP